jgi:3-methyladenine DNA glycosylase AlkD
MTKQPTNAPARFAGQTAPELIAHLRTLKNPANIAGQRRFGITPQTEQLGIAIPVLRQLARPHRNDHSLALELWASGIHEARLLAAFIDDPAKVTHSQMDAWAHDFDSWDVCDLTCGNLFDRTPFALKKAEQWSKHQNEFVKRAGFVLMAATAVHAKDLPDALFLAFLPTIRREATDERNFVRKAVNWALRQIGKRNPRLRRAAITEAKAIAKIDSRAARWIASDALRELQKRT